MGEGGSVWNRTERPGSMWAVTTGIWKVMLYQNTVGFGEVGDMSLS